MLYSRGFIGSVTALLLSSAAINAAINYSTRIEPTYFETVIPAMEYELSENSIQVSNRIPSKFWRKRAACLDVIFQPESFDTAIAVNCLGLDRYEHGNYREAAKLFELSLRLKAITGEPIARAAVMNNLAKSYQSMNRFDEAEPLYRSSISLRQECFRPISSLVVPPMINLASMFIAEQRYSEAIELLKKAILIEEANTQQSSAQMGNKFRRWPPINVYVATAKLSKISKIRQCYSQASMYTKQIEDLKRDWPTLNRQSLQIPL